MKHRTYVRFATERAGLKYICGKDSKIIMNDIGEAIDELNEIIGGCYGGFSEQFTQELLKSLKEKTGSDCLGILCSHILEQNHKNKKSHNFVTI